MLAIHNTNFDIELVLNINTNRIRFTGMWSPLNEQSDQDSLYSLWPFIYWGIMLYPHWKSEQKTPTFFCWSFPPLPTPCLFAGGTSASEASICKPRPIQQLRNRKWTVWLCSQSQLRWQVLNKVIDCVILRCSTAFWAIYSIVNLVNFIHIIF